METRNYWNPSLPQNQARSPEQMAEYLLSRRNITPAGCWEWTGGLSKSGYGKVKWRLYGDLRVHRVAAMLWLRFPLTDTRCICHHCDNRKCFNPEHLFVGTSRDNQLDCVAKGRNPQRRKTHCKHGHIFDPENTYFDKKGRRHCRKCHVTQELDRYRRRRIRQ
jgi:hypothetical protein